MADITIHTRVVLTVTVNAPTHRLIYFLPDAMHLTDLPVTGSAFDAGRYVGLVTEEYIGRFLNPVNASPWRLFASSERGCQLLHFGAFGSHCVVAAHARRRIGYRRAGGLIGVLVAEATFELWPFLFSEVLPVIEFDGLNGPLGSRAYAQQYQSGGDDRKTKD
jgi:hypothetical protein